ncbi:glycosyl hydrolase family 92-domain-containing protein [Elsinoe ampelina]|uniref:Glycosyl hydrolase family 92-domain-containing protein n=1 Tax=Elsinoe ampelina TaxID=302913 RepID=A0A6A6GDN0_9PEZI|nr:glycosyl hydrolase family 92-domain-containing protein [Elsinoe ampelina]
MTTLSCTLQLAYCSLVHVTKPGQHLLVPKWCGQGVVDPDLLSVNRAKREGLDVWRNDGFFPDGRSSNFNGRTQGGSNADNVLADAYVKGVRGQIDWDDAYEAIRMDAEQVPVNNNDPIAPEASTKEGRGALPDWQARPRRISIGHAIGGTTKTQRKRV